MGRIYPLLVCALVVVAAITLVTGEIPWNEVVQGAWMRLTSQSSLWNPLLDERIPRLIVLVCTVASLAVAAAVMQALFRNPLASPSVLGISFGGTLLGTSVFIMGWHFDYPFAIPIATFTGCLLTLGLVYGLTKIRGGIHMTTLILTGIAISTLLLAIQGAITYAIRDQWQIIQTLTEWEAGSTADRHWKHVHMQLPLTLIGLMGCWSYRGEIDILALGEEEATNLGVEVGKVRWRLFLCVALLTGGALAAVGLISFFGLVLPHLIRKIHGPVNRHLIPLCMLGGSVTLCTMDLILRLGEIRAFSIGNISTILGGVFFLVLLLGPQRQTLGQRI